MSKPSLPWYKDGLRFECTGCGQCCTGSPGYVWISEEDIHAISNYLDISIEDFIKLYVRKVENRYSLKEKNDSSYDCIFLEGKRCSIYPVRPVQCSTYPWWPSHLESPKAWKELASCCEGINPEAKLIDEKEIDNQLKLYLNKHPKEHENQ